MNKEETSPQDIASFTRVASSSAEKASNSLSTLINRTVIVETTEGVIVPPYVLSEQLGSPDHIFTNVAFRLSGGVNGFAWLMLPEDHSIRLAEILTTSQGITSPDKSMIESGLKEIGNIIIGSFLNEISQYIKEPIQHSLPDIVTDMLKATLDELTSEVSLTSDETLAFVTNIAIIDISLIGSVVLLVDAESSEKILGHL